MKLVKLIVGPAIALLATAANAPSLSVLSQLQPGRWALTSRDGDTPRSICMSDPRVLLALKRPASACSEFVLASDATSATVHFTCPGSGHGRTTIRVETPRLAQLQTQGIIGNAPFNSTLEARRVGECSSGDALSLR